MELQTVWIKRRIHMNFWENPKRPEKVEFEEVTPNPYFCVKTKHLRPDGGKGPV